MAIQIPVWPADVPLLDGFSRQPTDPFNRTEMDSGLARTRRRFRVFPISISVSFLLSGQQYDQYYDFCVSVLNGYSDWFMVVVDGPGGCMQKRCRWLSAPTEKRLGGGRWEISGQIETLSNF